MIRIDQDISGRIKVTLPYNPHVVSKIKTVTSRKWHKEDKYWSFPHSPQVLNELLAALDGEKLHIDPLLGDLLPKTTARKCSVSKPDEQRLKSCLSLTLTLSVKKCCTILLEQYRSNIEGGVK